jgi:mannose-6-phosphate isomerase-like protein (cupin superfamily)/DNA-binding Xre family transcriptional regulator
MARHLKIHSSIGERIARLRADRRMTLDALARATGFTKSYLSKIENARKVPPIGSLSRIAVALDSDIAGFFDNSRPSGRDAGVCVVRAGERRPVVRGGTAFGYDYLSLAYRKHDKKMEPFIFTFPAKIDSHVFFDHAGEEFLFVLKGRIEFQVGGERWVLREGDSLYFDSHIPHRGWSLGGAAKVLVVIYKSDPRK